MQLMILSFIDDWWNGFCSKALTGIASFFCKLVYSLENVYFYLLGTENIPNTQELNIFEQIFANKKTNDFLLIFFSIAGIIWLFCFLVSLIKGMTNQDTPGAVKKAIINSVKAILGIVVIPFLCLIFFRVSLHLITYTVQSLNGGSDTPIAAQIWEAGYNGYEVREAPIGYSKLPFTFSYDSLSEITFIGYGGNFFYVGHEVHFDYFIVIIGAAILSICMGIATIKLCGRLINIVILYIISPVVVSTISVDDGKRYEAWKEISLSKLFSIMGSVLGMYIYLVLLQVVSSARDSITKDGGINIFIGTIFFLICAIAGALMVIKGSDMLDSIVSQNSGGQDGLSPIAMGHLGRVLGRGIGKTKNALLGKPSAKGGTGGGSNSGGTGNGTFSKNGSYGAWGSLKNAMENSPMGKALNSIKQNGLVGAGVNAIAGIGTGIKDHHQINKDLKESGFKHPNFHPILRHEQKQAIKKDRQRLQDFKNQGVDKSDLKELKGNRLGSEEFKNNAIAIAQKYKKRAEEGVYR